MAFRLPKAEQYIRVLRSPLGRRLAAAVFLAVLFIEAVLFVPSAIRLEKQMNEDIRDQARALFQVISASAGTDKGALFLAAVGAIDVADVRGLTVMFDDGTPSFSLGEPPVAARLLPPGADFFERVDSAAKAVDLSWYGRGDGYDFTVAFRMDTGTIPSAIRDFGFRVGGLTLLICLIATLAIMAALARHVLAPIIDLRESLDTTKGDIEKLTLTARHLDRPDEIGDLFRSVAEMTMEIAAKVHEIEALARFPAENPNPVLRVKRDGTVMLANPASVVIPELFADATRAVITPSLQPAVRTAFTTADPQTRILDLGSETYQFRINPVTGAAFINIYGRDITDQVAAEALLRHANANLEREVERRTERLRQNEAALTRNILELEGSRQALQRRSRELAELAEKYGEEKERAQASEKAKSEFLATMSHEIRTPMTAILGLADILLDGELQPLQRDTLHKLKGAGDSLLTIINDILDLSKVQAGKLEIELIDFNLHAVIREALELIRPTAEEKGLLVSLEIDADLPGTVKSDPTRIRQILLNLVGNGVKFTQTGSVRIAVSHDVVDAERINLQFFIIDTGIGIPEEVCDRLFDDFTQADTSTSRLFEGSGLGLAISKRLCALMGGEIGVVSELGQGSTFWFTLQVMRSNAEVPAGVKHTAATYTAARPLAILIAEDNALNRMILRSLLEPMGHVLTMVETGLAAVTEVQAADYDVVLMDIRMPVMNGPDATSAIRQLPPPKGLVPIIAVTADALAENVSGYLAAGMTACVTKPIDRGELVGAIDEVLNETIHIPKQAPPPVEPAPAPDDGNQPEPTPEVLDFLSALDDLARNTD